MSLSCYSGTALLIDTIVHSKKTEPWGVFHFFQMFSKIFQFSLFQCLKDAFVLLTFQFQVYSTLGKQLSFFSRETQWFCLFTHKQAFAAGVCRTYTIPTCGAQRPVADDFALQLHWCDAERTRRQQKPWYVLVQKRIPELFFFVKADVLFLKALLLCLFGGERQGSVVRPFPASSPLSIVQIDVSEISKPPTRLPHPVKWQP